MPMPKIEEKPKINVDKIKTPLENTRKRRSFNSSFFKKVWVIGIPIKSNETSKNISKSTIIFTFLTNFMF